MLRGCRQRSAQLSRQHGACQCHRTPGRATRVASRYRDLPTRRRCAAGAVRSRWSTTSKFIEAMTDQHWIRRGTSICWYKHSTTTSVAKCYWTGPLSSSRIKVAPRKSPAPNRGESFVRSPTRRHVSHARPARERKRGSERLRITWPEVHRPSTMRRFVKHIDKALSETQLPRPADFAPDGRFQILTMTIIQEMSG